MNEPPMDSLPPWQMAQDRGGYRGQGGGVSVYVFVCMGAREKARASKREVGLLLHWGDQLDSQSFLQTIMTKVT